MGCIVNGFQGKKTLIVIPVICRTGIFLGDGNTVESIAEITELLMDI